MAHRPGEEKSLGFAWQETLLGAKGGKPVQVYLRAGGSGGYSRWFPLHFTSCSPPSWLTKLFKITTLNREIIYFHGHIRHILTDPWPCNRIRLRTEVPIPYMFGLLFRPKFQGISPENMAKHMARLRTSILGSWISHWLAGFHWTSGLYSWFLKWVWSPTYHQVATNRSMKNPGVAWWWAVVTADFWHVAWLDTLSALTSTLLPLHPLKMRHEITVRSSFLQNFGHQTYPGQILWNAGSLFC